MKKCKFCGFSNSEENRFCGGCGRPLYLLASKKRFILKSNNPQFADDYELERDKILIGRALDCNLVIKHISVSRHHANLEYSEDLNSYILQDLNSKNGTFVNDSMVITPRVIKPDDNIKFGDVSFNLIVEDVDTRIEKSFPGRYKLLLDLSKTINSELNLEEVLKRVIDAVLKITKAERAFIIVGKDIESLEIKLAKNSNGEWLDPKNSEISFNTVKKVFTSKNPFITIDVSGDESLTFHKSVIKLGLNSVMAVPLKFKNKVFGVIYVDSKMATTSFDKDDLEIFTALSDQAAVAIENARLVDENKSLLFSTIEALAESIEKRDPYTGGHTRRVLEISVKIAEKLNLDKQTIENLKLGALLHDIGKIGIDDKILRKEGRLSEEEYLAIKRHPQLGYEIVKHIKPLKDAIPGILYHHEKEDGTGYPKGLKNDEIPLIAKIISTADAFDAMTTDRPYRKGLSVLEATKEIVKYRGSQFSPEIVDAFLEVLKDEGYEFNFSSQKP